MYYFLFILLFSLFLLLFIILIIHFNTIYGYHCIILNNFYLYLLYFQQKVFNFNQISRFQTGPNLNTRIKENLIFNFLSFHFYIFSILHRVSFFRI